MTLKNSLFHVTIAMTITLTYGPSYDIEYWVVWEPWNINLTLQLLLLKTFFFTFSLFVKFSFSPKNNSLLSFVRPLMTSCFCKKICLLPFSSTFHFRLFVCDFMRCFIQISLLKVCSWIWNLFLCRLCKTGLFELLLVFLENTTEIAKKTC